MAAPTLPRRARRLLAAALLVGLFLPFGTMAPAKADPAIEASMFALTNQSRAAYGLAPLQYDPAASAVARGWAAQMAATGTLAHNPDLVSQVAAQVTGSSWQRIGENVGFGPSTDVLQATFMASASHRSNILGDYNRVGVGGVQVGGTVWVTLNFIKGPPIPDQSPPQPPPPPRPQLWYLRTSATPGTPQVGATYGLTTYVPVKGDWDGNGTDTIGVFDGGTWYLRNSVGSGRPDRVVSYGSAGAIPVVGDWDGNGTDTIGVYEDGWWYLRNSNTPGPPDIVVHYGYPGALPVPGDWDGNGTDTIGVYDNGLWYLRSSNTPGAPSLAIAYGTAGYLPVVGDWAGIGVDGIGVFTNGAWFLQPWAMAGAPWRSLWYGTAGYTPMPGDWSGSGVDGVGVITAG